MATGAAATAAGGVAIFSTLAGLAALATFSALTGAATGVTTFSEAFTALLAAVLATGVTLAAGLDAD